MTQTPPSLFSRALLLAVILLLLAGATASAQVVSQLVVSEVDAASFPEVKVTFRALQEGGINVQDVSGVTVSENGAPVEDISLTTIDVGVELIFAIDANDSINQRDGGELNRREKVRDALNLFADEFMAEGPDLVSIVVPVDAEHPNGELLRDGIFVNELKNAANFYVPDIDGAVDVEDLLTRALAIAAENEANGRAQAIVLFSDAALAGSPVNLGAIAASAKAQHVAIFAAILGSRADANEIGNMEALTGPTNGTWVHMPETGEVAPILALATALREQHQLTYRSRSGGSGAQSVTLSLGGQTAEGSYSVTLAPAEVAILLDNSRPIIRVADDPEAEITTIEPTEQAVLGQISFPDGQPRNIVSVALVVDGVLQQAMENPTLGEGNTFNLAWDISNLDSGTYNLAVEVTDELGLEGVSEALPLEIEVQRPRLVEPTSAASTGGETGVVPAEEGEAEADNPLALENLTGNVWFWVAVAVVGLFALFIVFLLLFALIRRIGRRKNEPATAPLVQPQAALDAEATQILAPAFVQRGSNAYLEPLENASEHGGSIYLSGNNVAMGRDPKLAQIIFKDKSVSRLHARIMESNGEYRLYDEGSASGTYHNYERVGLTPQALKDNDELHLGRVHLRFKMSQAAQDDDATQVFGPAAGAPQRPAQRQAPGQPQPELEDVSTQPFMPHQPSGGAPPRQAPRQPEDDDPDGTSTQPYMPHKPNR